MGFISSLLRAWCVLSVVFHIKFKHSRKAVFAGLCMLLAQSTLASSGLEVPSSRFQNELNLLPCTSPGCALFPMLISTCSGKSSRNLPCPAFLCWTVLIMSLVSLCGRETKMCRDKDLQKWSWVGKLPWIFNKLSANLPEDLMLWAFVNCSFTAQLHPSDDLQLKMYIPSVFFLPEYT